MALLLTLTTLSGDTGYVEEVVVDKAARGQHIITALMRSLLDLAAQKGLRFVDLTSRPSRDIANNRPAQHLVLRLQQLVAAAQFTQLSRLDRGTPGQSRLPC